MRGSNALMIGLALAAQALLLQPLTQVDGAIAATGRINGWYPCHKSLASQQAPPSTEPPFECAEVQVPLCHDGICSSAKTIDLFVKRLLAMNPRKAPNKAMWFLQGGPGTSSVASTFHIQYYMQIEAAKFDSESLTCTLCVLV